MLNRVRGMGFGWSLNPYRGCYHRCVFCYARNTHAFLERDGVADWGSALYVKINAPEIVRRELAKPSWKGESVFIGTATDPYQPLEGRYRLTRRILEELVRAKTPAHITTRSPLVVRDIDVLRDLSRAAGVTVCISLPTLDAELARKIEPTVAPPAQRLRTIESLARAGIRTGVAIAPVLPHLTDDARALRTVFAAAANAGASTAWHGALRLSEIPRESYFAFLRDEFPALVARYDAHYRAAALDRDYAGELDWRVRDAKRTIAFAPPPIVPRDERGVQLSLIA